MKLTERLKGAFNSLRGLKTATHSPRPDSSGERIGTDPALGDEDILSAAFSYFKHYTHQEPDRVSVYSDMDEMYQYVIVHSALEAYIDDAAQPDLATGLTVWPVADNSEVQAELIRLLENLENENRITGDMWGMCKYGDYFPLFRYEADKGIFDAIPIDPRIVHRQETPNRVLLGFDVTDNDQDGESNSIPRFKPWDMGHFKIIGKRPTDKYGTPFFEQVRIIYKVLKLMEEQMTIYRMNMHPDRLFYKVFTGSASPDERRRIVRIWKREQEKNTSFNHDSGRFTSQYAPWAVNQNIYWPVGAEDNVSGVEKFDGSANSGDIFDVEYMRDLLFSGLRIPKAYMGFEDSQGYRGTDTLSAQSLKFARGVRRVQRHYLAGLTRLCNIHLALRGYNPQAPEHQFELKMTPVSYLDEAHRSELYAKRFEAVNFMLDIGQRMQENFTQFNSQSWAAYVLKEFGQFDDQMLDTLLTPDTGQAADATYTPQGTAFRWENSEDDRKKIQEQVEKNPDIQEALKTLRTVDVDFQSSMNSKTDVGFRSMKKGLEEAVRKKESTDHKLYDQALKENQSKAERLPEEQKAKMERELRDIVEAARSRAFDGDS